MNRFLTCFIATHAGISPSDTSTAPHGTTSIAYGMLPYQMRTRRKSEASVLDLSPDYFRRQTT